MGATSRGIRNVYRNKSRAFLTVALLGLSIGIFITMVQTSASISSQSQQLKEQVQNLIEVRAAGATAMGRGVQALDENVIDKISGIQNIKNIQKYLYVRDVDNSKKYPVSVVAGVKPIISELRVNSHGEVGTPTLVKGRAFKAEDENKKVAIVGTIYAQENNLDIGSILKLNDVSLEVIGIFDAGFVFGNNQVFVPLNIAQKYAFDTKYISSSDKLSQLFVTVNSVDNVNRVERELRNVLTDADVLSGQKNVVITSEALSAIQSNSSLGAFFSAGIAMLIVLFTMILVGKERTKEIGILKAIGASNSDVAKQFIVEAISLSFIGSIAGITVFVFAAPIIANSILGLSATSLTGLAGGMGAQAASSVVQLSLNSTLVLYSLLLAVLLAIIGSLYPVYRAVKLNPAEALRYE